jgi:N-glycosyltransferase
VPTWVFAPGGFRAEIERLGGTFVDLFAVRPPDRADATSIPLPCRGVSFAGYYGDDVVREVAALDPGVVLHDTFAVIGVVVANHLRLPRVNVCAGHNQAPEPTVAALRHDPRVNISEECWRAVRMLQERHGLPDASPFSYVTAVSPDLNVYCEPPQFLREDERAPFEPIAFFGSLTDELSDHAIDASPFATGSGPRLRLYASFGTIVWRYYANEALAALGAIAECVATMDDACALLSLGGRPLDETSRRLIRRNVQVEPYVDQWNALQEASVCVTHHGLNSTHEAVYQGTPMISYPFFGDQPSMAQRCQELGVAVPLVDSLRGRVTADDVRAALTRLANEHETICARLAQAHQWELEVMRARPAVIERIIGLMR